MRSILTRCILVKARDNTRHAQMITRERLSVACDLLLDLSFLLFSHAFFSQWYKRVVRLRETTRFSAFYLFLYVLLITSSPVVVVVVVVAPSSQSSSSYIVVVCLCCLFWLCVSLCCQSFSGSVTVTMAGSTQTAQTGNTGHATVNTNSQTHTSSEQQLPVPTPLHYPCKICGK